MPLAGLADPVDPWQRIQVKEEVEVSYGQVIITYFSRPILVFI